MNELTQKQAYVAGLREPSGHEEGQLGAVPAQAGDDRKAPSSNGCASRLTFPTKVKVLIVAASLLVVSAGWMIGKWLMSAVELLCNITISPMSGLWFDAGCAVAFFLVCTLFYCIASIASDADERIAQSGGAR